MMISPDGFIMQNKDKSYEELLPIRDELIKAIQSFENHRHDQKSDIRMHPSPEVVYQCNLMYLGRLCELIADKYNREIVWGEADSSNVLTNNVWLLSWNPDKWNWKKYAEWCNGTKYGVKFTESWTCRSEKPAVGDEFYLIKQGDKPRGIIGHGHIVRESYSAPHYNAERAKKGEKTNHIDVEFDYLLNYETEPILDQGHLKKILPDQHWSPQGSGIQIREEIVPKLNELWVKLKNNKD